MLNGTCVRIVRTQSQKYEDCATYSFCEVAFRNGKVVDIWDMHLYTQGNSKESLEVNLRLINRALTLPVIDFDTWEEINES